MLPCLVDLVGVQQIWRDCHSQRAVLRDVSRQSRGCVCEASLCVECLVIGHCHPLPTNHWLSTFIHQEIINFHIAFVLYHFLMFFAVIAGTQDGATLDHIILQFYHFAFLICLAC